MKTLMRFLFFFLLFLMVFLAGCGIAEVLTVPERPQGGGIKESVHVYPLTVIFTSDTGIYQIDCDSVEFDISVAGYSVYKIPPVSVSTTQFPNWKVIPK